MEQRDEYIEINLKGILFYVLRRWKPVVVVAVVLALLLGAFQAVGEYHTIVNTDEENEYWIEYHKYHNQLALLEDQVAALEGKIDTLQDYMDHAVMMKADYRNVYIAKATYYIDSNYRIMPDLNYQNPDKTYTLTWYYQNYLQDYSIFEAISEEVGIETKYLMDLVEISTANDNTLNLSVSHPNQRFANRIMEALQNQLNQVRSHLEDTIAEHSLNQMLNTCGVYVDESLKERQQIVYDEMLGYQEALIEQKQKLNDLEEAGEPNAPNVVTAFIKWFVLGGVAGGVVMAIIFAAKALFAGRTYSPEDISSRYGIPVLGGIVAGNVKYDPITAWVRKLEGRQMENTEENQQFLAENLRNYCKDWKDVLITSDVSSEESAVVSGALAARLQDIQFQTAGSLTKDPKALSLLPKCDTVIFAVTADQSRNKDISKAMQIIRDCGKTVVGIVFIDR